MNQSIAKSAIEKLSDFSRFDKSKGEHSICRFVVAHTEDKLAMAEYFQTPIDWECVLERIIANAGEPTKVFIRQAIKESMSCSSD